MAGDLLLPLLFAGVLLYGLWRRVDVFAAFTGGAGKGLSAAVGGHSSYICSAFQLYAVDFDGRRLYEIPFAVRDGKTTFRMITSGRHGAVAAYELIARSLGGKAGASDKK